MKDKRSNHREPEVTAMTIIFILLCAAVLLSLVDAWSWGMELAGYLYALIALIGLVTCARSKSFMAVDVLVQKYPAKVAKFMLVLKDVVMLVIFAALFVISILGVINQVKTPTYSELLHIPNIILYIIQAVVYPVAVFFYAKAMKTEKEAK